MFFVSKSKTLYWSQSPILVFKYELYRLCVTLIKYFCTMSKLGGLLQEPWFLRVFFTVAAVVGSLLLWSFKPKALSEPTFSNAPPPGLAFPSCPFHRGLRTIGLAWSKYLMKTCWSVCRWKKSHWCWQVQRIAYEKWEQRQTVFFCLEVKKAGKPAVAKYE